MPAPKFRRPFYYHHWFNPWHGCTKIAPGCANCWAEQWTDARFFGKNVGRKLTPEAVWLTPAQWNAKAAQQRWRRNVACMSTGDLFEDRRDLDEPRSRVLDIIAECEWLDFWIFTRRPGLIETLAPPRRRMTWQKNVFLGISIEDQAHADELIPALFKTPAAGYHVSCVPLLGPINLRPFLTKLCFVKTGLESLRAMRRGGMESGACPTDVARGTPRGLRRGTWISCTNARRPAPTFSPIISTRAKKIFRRE